MNGSKIQLNEMGRIVERAWNDLSNHYCHIELGTFGIMPNHVHGIVVIKYNDANIGAGLGPAPTATIKQHGLSKIVRAFKSSGIPLWQCNYYEHIIRNRDEWNRIHYISNPILPIR